MDGKGTFHWSNQSKYIGEYKDDLKHGYGVLNWENGKSYKGNWI